MTYNDVEAEEAVAIAVDSLASGVEVDTGGGNLATTPSVTIADEDCVGLCGTVVVDGYVESVGSVATVDVVIVEEVVAADAVVSVVPEEGVAGHGGCRRMGGSVDKEI